MESLSLNFTDNLEESSSCYRRRRREKRERLDDFNSRLNVVLREIGQWNRLDRSTRLVRLPRNLSRGKTIQPLKGIHPASFELRR